MGSDVDIVYLETTLTFSTSSNGQSHGVPRIQGEDSGWLDCIGLDQEQIWKDREQEEILYFQEELLDDCLLEGKEGSEDQRLRRNQEGLRALQEGKELLNMLVM